MPMKVTPDRIKARAELIRRGLRVRNSLELNCGARRELELTDKGPSTSAQEDRTSEAPDDRDEMPLAS